MPKFPSIPRLSIIVPVGTDVSAFEETLVSVLENRPAGCEIIVAHDGSYQDPFQLGDEVRFAVSNSAVLTNLVTEGANESRGRFVHILDSGLKATNRWADAALDQFENQQTACVAPVIHDTDNGHVVAAGWCDTPKRLLQPIGAGQTTVDRRGAQRVLGTYLQASFWRRDVLRSVLLGYDAPSTVEANYAFARMVIAGGWCCTLAPNCSVIGREKDIVDPPSYARGQRLWAIKKAIDPSTKHVSITRVFASILKPSVMLETLGQSNGKSALAQVQRRLQMDQVASYCQQTPILAMPSRDKKNVRRAA